MTTTRSTTFSTSLGVAAILAILTGLSILGYGLLLVPMSPLGGSWIAAIGLSLSLSGLFATDWVGARLGLAASTRRTLSLAFGVFAVVLFVSFVVVNSASFEASSIESGTQSG